MSQSQSNIKSFQELSRRYAKEFGEQVKSNVGSVYSKVEHLSNSRKVNANLERLKAEFAELSQKGQSLINEISRLSEKVSGDIKQKISRA